MAETAGQTAQHRASTDGIDLMQNETALENRRPGWAVWSWQIALAVVVLLVGAAGQSIGGIVAGAVIFGYVVISRMQSRYIVTDERVKATVGLLSKRSREYRIPDIQSLTTSQSIVERIFSHGSVTLKTASNDQITWTGVPEYSEVANTIREEQRAYDAA